MNLLVPDNCYSPINYYLPHHGVFKSQNNSTKLRVVFDGSATTTSGGSITVPYGTKGPQKLLHLQGHSYRRFSDTGPPSYRDPNMCNYSPTNRASISKKGPGSILIQGPFRASYACLHLVREEYWPLNGRNNARRIVHQCIKCFKAKSKIEEQLMTSLPKERVTVTPPLRNTGIELCGPFYIKYKNQQNVREELLFRTMLDDSVMENKNSGLVIEPATRPIDLDTIPQDGFEFIHQARLQEELVDSVADSNLKELELLTKKKARDFCLFATELKTKKTTLQQQFPRDEDFCQKKDEVEWCQFLLGSKLCAEIYETDDTGVQGQLPLLSFILYFSQDEIQILIKYIYQWFLKIGMPKPLSMWLYALLACLEIPVDVNFQQVLENFQMECKRYLKYDYAYDVQVYFISDILFENFCAH
ncbi:integrase catalytic domain-containing protein [Trichonephila clavipes]|nr:integrase catalytic domain-containing protein [Trichonephila clavipes]